MSYFKNFMKTIDAQRFTRPNNIILSSRYTPVYACTVNEPHIDYVNTIKALHSTIKKLKSLDQYGGFKDIIARETKYLQKLASNYCIYGRKLAQHKAKLTAQGISNIYACAQQLQVNSDWLREYVYNQIPNFIKHMSSCNLKDVIAGLQKYHPGSEYIELAKKHLSSKISEDYQYVEYATHEVTQFEEAGNYSNNILIRNIVSGSKVRYYAQLASSNFSSLLLNRKLPGYILHSE